MKIAKADSIADHTTLFEHVVGTSSTAARDDEKKRYGRAIEMFSSWTRGAQRVDYE
jgi:hypothetical protein